MNVKSPSVIVFCLFSNNVCLSTISQEILKFGTKLGDDKLYCVKENQPHIAYQSLYLSIILSPQQKILSQIS